MPERERKQKPAPKEREEVVDEEAAVVRFVTDVISQAVEDQATDRAYRIGQTKDVSVYLPILRE